MVRHARRWAVGVVCIGAAAGAARADDAALVDSPRYAAWSKCKPGASATLTGDIDMGQMGKMSVETTRVLQSLTPESATVSVKTTVTLMGQQRPPRTQTETIPAKEAKTDMHQTGTADVDAAGKTYKCKVFEMTPAAAGQATPPGRPGGTPAASPPKATVYVSDDAPGGVVKMEIANPTTGKVMTFLLTAVDAK